MKSIYKLIFNFEIFIFHWNYLLFLSKKKIYIKKLILIDLKILYIKY